jgi:NAD(P)-dependent dehydrogenase (short-subunit alcohol dehydrogenase family)
MADLRDTIAVVTGGASGIGFALARAYGLRGAHVLIADIDAEALDVAEVELAREGIESTAMVVDLRNFLAVGELRNRAQALGVIGAICMNAGVTASGNVLWKTSASQFDFVFDVNVRGLYHCVRSFVPALIAQARPAEIVITASMAGMVTSTHSGAYAASKAAVIAMAKALRLELQSAAPFLRLALLNPGMVKTNLMHTSASQAPHHGEMDADLVEDSHRALNQLGVADWVMHALANKRFWVFSPESDMFSIALLEEITEIQKALTA